MRSRIVHSTKVGSSTRTFKDHSTSVHPIAFPHPLPVRRFCSAACVILERRRTGARERPRRSARSWQATSPAGDRVRASVAPNDLLVWTISVMHGRKPSIRNTRHLTQDADRGAGRRTGLNTNLRLRRRRCRHGRLHRGRAFVGGPGEPRAALEAGVPIRIFRTAQSPATRRTDSDWEFQLPGAARGSPVLRQTRGTMQPAVPAPTTT